MNADERFYFSPRGFAPLKKPPQKLWRIFNEFHSPKDVLIRLSDLAKTNHGGVIESSGASWDSWLIPHHLAVTTPAATEFFKCHGTSHGGQPRRAGLRDSGHLPGDEQKLGQQSR